MQGILDFNSDITHLGIPTQLNNPFGLDIPDIAIVAAEEFQEFIALEETKWEYDFQLRPGKMFGVLVVRQSDDNLRYLGAVSGKLPGNEDYDKLVPSPFNEATHDYFLTKGLIEVTELGNQIKEASNDTQSAELIKKRSNLSKSIQRKLFENYHFLNLSGQSKNLLSIFKDAAEGKPPAATGECAAPKLLQYAIKHQLHPIAIAEFWWGNSLNTLERQHKTFYPACRSKCKPVLEYILENQTLYNNGQSTTKES